MRRTVNARVTPHLEPKTEGRPSAWVLAADLIPEQGVVKIQSCNVRVLARKGDARLARSLNGFCELNRAKARRPGPDFG